MEEGIHTYFEGAEIIDVENYSVDLTKHFSTVPEVAVPLLKSAKCCFEKIEKMLYDAPTFINAIKACVPEETLQVILSDEQKAQLAEGALELMTKKDGSLLANLINPETKKIVSNISLEKVNVSPEISQAMIDYTMQMQMAQLAEQIQFIQIAVEEVRQGQENDRLATAYSCQQKLLQAMMIKNPELKAMALLRIVSDAEDSRNLLMQSQTVNATFIRNQPESFWGKLVNGATPEKISARMNELRESLCAVNMVSLVEAMAYQEMGEPEAARFSLQYYGDYIKRTYLETKEFVERLDMIDSSPENYWSKAVPSIERQIQALPGDANMMIGENEDEAEKV